MALCCARSWTGSDFLRRFHLTSWWMAMHCTRSLIRLSRCFWKCARLSASLIGWVCMRTHSMRKILAPDLSSLTGWVCMRVYFVRKVPVAVGNPQLQECFVYIHTHFYMSDLRPIHYKKKVQGTVIAWQDDHAWKTLAHKRLASDLFR